MPASKPKTNMASAFRTEPCARAIDEINPMMMSEKYSAGTNCRAIFVSGGANRAGNIVATVQLGRGSGRERVSKYVELPGGAGSLKHKNEKQEHNKKKKQ